MEHRAATLQDTVERGGQPYCVMTAAYDPALALP